MEIGEIGEIGGLGRNPLKKMKKKLKKAVKKVIKVGTGVAKVMALSPVVAAAAVAVKSVVKKVEAKNMYAVKKLKAKRRVAAINAQTQSQLATNKLVAAQQQEGLAVQQAAVADATAQEYTDAGDYDQAQQYQDQSQQYQQQAQQYQEQSNQYLDQAYQGQAAVQQYQQQEPAVQQMEASAIREIVFEAMQAAAGQQAQQVTQQPQEDYGQEDYSQEDYGGQDDYMYGMGSIFSKRRKRIHAPKDRKSIAIRRAIRSNMRSMRGRPGSLFIPAHPAKLAGLSGLGELDAMVKAVLNNVAKAAKSTNIVVTLQQLGIQFPRFVDLTNNKQVFEYINRPYVRSRVSSIPGGSGALLVAQYRLAHKTNDPGSSVGQFMAAWGPTMVAKSGSSDSEWQRYADQLLVFCTSQTDANNAYNWAVTKVRDRVRRYSAALNIAYPYELALLCEGVVNGYRLVSGATPLVPVIEAAKNIIQPQSSRDIANKIAAYVAGQVRAGVPAATASAPLIPAPQPIAPDPSTPSATVPTASISTPFISPADAAAWPTPALDKQGDGIAKYALPALAVGIGALLLLKRKR